MKNPRVGDVVFLNDFGMAQVEGLRSLEEIKQAQRMVITEVDYLGDGFTPLWHIQVDQPLINRYFLDASMVDLYTN